MELLKLNQYQEKSYGESSSKKGYVKYGDDNQFPQYLVNLYKSSATHNALCTSIAYMIFGDGVQVDTDEARIKVEEWGLNDEIRKSTLDFKIQGGFALELIYSIDRTTISKVRHLPFENIRSGEVNDKEKVEFYYYKKDWADDSEEAQVIHGFNPKEANEYPVQVLYVKPFSPGSFFYPKPDYIGSVDYIELDKEIAKYHINNIKNGLAPSYVINWANGKPTPEAKRKLRSDIETQLTGATNAGKFIMTFSDDPARKPSFEAFPLSDADKQYQFLSTEVSDKIMIGHRVVSSAMFGVKTAGQLGNTQELEIAAELFNKNVINPYQAIVIDAIESLLTAANVPATVTLEEEIIEEVTEEPQVTEEELSEYQTLVSDFLLEAGEEVDESEWELIDARKVDYDTESIHDSAFEFTKHEEKSFLNKAKDFFGTSRAVSQKPGKTSKQDSDIIKVRYAYAPNSVSGNSRDFCRKMVSAKRAYRKEDIEAASKEAVNPGWGPNGANKYDIWLYKGGGSCHHFWERRTYLKKSNARISVNEAKKIIQNLPIEERKEAKLPINDRRVAKRPTDMPNHGFLPSNKRAKNIK